LSPEDAMTHVINNTPLNKLRSVLSGIVGRMEQESLQRYRPSIQEIRAAEFNDLEHLLDRAEELGFIKRL